MADTGARIYDFLRRQGYSPAAAAGIIGNTQQESSNNPNAPGGGLIQGQGGRTSHGSLQQQLQGILGELRGPERGTAAAIKNASDPRKAALIFSQRFERPGEPRNDLRQQYAAEALKRYGGRQVGTAQAANSTGSTGPQLETSTTHGDPEALALALEQVKQLSGPEVLAAGSAPKRPTFAAGSTAPEGAQAPAPISPAQPKGQPQLQQLLEAALGGGDVSSKVTAGAAAPHGEVAEEHPGHYVNPLPGFTKGRTDQGVDYSAKPGTPIRAIGNAKVLGISPNWYKGQPYVSYELLDGPRKGKVVFVAEQIAPSVKAGQRVRAGQSIGTYASSGTGIEIGYGTRTGGQTLAKATTGYTEGQETDAGKRVRALLERLGAR